MAEFYFHSNRTGTALVLHCVPDMPRKAEICALKIKPVHGSVDTSPVSDRRQVKNTSSPIQRPG
jgi:hypothetical protein